MSAAAPRLHTTATRTSDLVLSYAIRARGGELLPLDDLAWSLDVARHALWQALSVGDREERCRKNLAASSSTGTTWHDLHHHGGEGELAGHDRLARLAVLRRTRTTARMQLSASFSRGGPRDGWA